MFEHAYTPIADGQKDFDAYEKRIEPVPGLRSHRKCTFFAVLLCVLAGAVGFLTGLKSHSDQTTLPSWATTMARGTLKECFLEVLLSSKPITKRYSF